MPNFEQLWFNKVDALKQEADDMISRALLRAGWKHTSQTPGSVWMWDKEINGVVYRVTQDSAAAFQEHFDRKDYFNRHPEELGD